MRYYIIAGEASGDLHGSNLIKNIKIIDSNAIIRAFGGDKMQIAGAEISKHYKNLDFMGFSEVLLNLKTIINNFSYCKKDIKKFKPDVLVLIDFPGFNLPIAKWAHKKNIKTVYYISPQIWAWNESRVHTIKKVIDEMLVILPFEEDFYKKYNCKVHYVGHPLLDAINEEQDDKEFLNQPKSIALLPGSRKQEIKKMLPMMNEIASLYNDYNFVVAGMSNIGKDFYAQYINSKNISIVIDNPKKVIKNAEAAIVTSGTATLECAIYNVPLVVCYSANIISYHIARKVSKVKYISLVNLLMDKAVIKELIQSDMTINNVSAEFEKLLTDLHYRNEMLNNFAILRKKLEGKGASEKAARIIYETILRFKD